MVTKNAVNSFSDAECTGTVEVIENLSLEESDSCWKTEDCVALVCSGTPPDEALDCDELAAAERGEDGAGATEGDGEGETGAEKAIAWFFKGVLGGAPDVAVGLDVAEQEVLALDEEVVPTVSEPVLGR